MDDYMKEDPDYVKTVDEHFGVTNYSEDIPGLKQAGKVWSPKRIVPAKQLAQSQSKNPTTSTNHPTLAMKSQSYASVIKKAPKVVRGTRTGTSEGPSRELTETLQAKHQPHADFCVRGIPRVEDSKFDSVKDYNAFIAKQLEDVGIPTRFVSVYVPARGDRRSSTFARIELSPMSGPHSTMKAQRIDLVIPLAVVLVVVVRGELPGDGLTEKHPSLKNWEMAHLLRILDTKEYPNLPPSRLMIGNSPTPPNRGPRCWREPWYISALPGLHGLWRLYPWPTTTALVVGVVGLVICLVQMCNDFMEAMDRCEGWEKIKLMARMLAVVAIITLAVSLFMQFTWIILTLVGMLVE
ncbi:uncharacterized protein LOC129581413 [Paramacrobiotus metropolitanus]|uniref:uncharacterized protein LOC129581413 n=1 Tax=Paramacrobiotus metropolitanus TaxID=2943436 RepID=UPI0024463264|nr:uncharacterized protein LOC129581413 [Paramacrobiotus metropolitanus]